jgi:hypothetical protein
MSISNSFVTYDPEYFFLKECRETGLFLASAENVNWRNFDIQVWSVVSISTQVQPTKRVIYSPQQFILLNKEEDMATFPAYEATAIWKSLTNHYRDYTLADAVLRYVLEKSRSRKTLFLLPSNTFTYESLVNTLNRTTSETLKSRVSLAPHTNLLDEYNTFFPNEHLVRPSYSSLGSPSLTSLLSLVNFYQLYFSTLEFHNYDNTNTRSDNS